MTDATHTRAAKLAEMADALREHDKRIGLSLLPRDDYIAEAEWAEKLGMTAESIRRADDGRD